MKIDAHIAAVQSSVARPASEEFVDSDDDLEAEEEDWGNGKLVEALEASELADGFQEYSLNEWR